MDTFDLFERLALALGIGLLIGLERGWREREEGAGSRTAGIRTFTLIGLLGGIWAAMTPGLGPVPLAAAGLAMAAAFTLFYWREMRARKEYSVTSVIVALVAFALGAFAVLGNRAAAGAAGVATVGLLAARTSLHDFLRKLTWPELRSGVLLLAMTFVLLPVLPREPIDPWGSFNPYELWLLTVLIAVVSFFGYVGVRLIGKERGLIISAAAGALISSTTVTLNNARIARENSGKPAGSIAVSICVAWIVSLLRMTVIAAAINTAMLAPLLLPVASASAALFLAILFFQRGLDDRGTSAPVDYANPLDIGFVLRFGALLSVIAVATNLARNSFGEGGLLGLAGISGFVDVDPITLSVSRLAGASITPVEASEAILLAAASNLVTKMALPLMIGGVRFGLQLIVAGFLAIAAGAVAILVNGV